MFSNHSVLHPPNANKIKFKLFVNYTSCILSECQAELVEADVLF